MASRLTPLRLHIFLPATLSCAAVLFAAGCDNSVHLTEVLPPLDAASVDAAAGSWRMILLSAPNQFTVSAPTTVSSPAYLAELDAIKAAQSNLTDAQRQSIARWSGGGGLRWEQAPPERGARVY